MPQFKAARKVCLKCHRHAALKLLIIDGIGSGGEIYDTGDGQCQVGPPSLPQRFHFDPGFNITNAASIIMKDDRFMKYRTWPLWTYDHAARQTSCSRFDTVV